MKISDKRKWYQYLRIGDLIIYIVVILAGIIMLYSAPSRLMGGSENGQLPLKAYISVNNQVVHIIEEEQLIAGGQYLFEADGYHYEVVYGNGRVRINKADCPDQVCVLTGWLTRNGQISACVPGRVLIRIEGHLSTDNEAGGQDDLDVILK